MLKICGYDREFLECSWHWLKDKEIKELTMTPDFSRQQQKEFFISLEQRKDYKIYGFRINNKPAGACGLKNIRLCKAEYWGYIGEKQFWGKGYGKQMINEMIKVAQREEISHVYLKVGKSNIRAIKLYNRFGFTVNHELSSEKVTHMYIDV